MKKIKDNAMIAGCVLMLLTDVFVPVSTQDSGIPNDVTGSDSTTSEYRTQVDLLRDVEEELKTIQSSLEELKIKIDEFQSANDSSVVSSSPILSDSDSGEFLAEDEISDRIILRANEDICLPGEGPDDLCVRLKEVLSKINEVTKNIIDEDINEAHLQDLETSSKELDDIISLIEGDETFINGVDIIAFNKYYETTKSTLSSAITRVENELSDGYVLISIIAVIGGMILISFVVLTIYTAKKKSEMNKKKRFRQLNAVPVPVESFLDEGNVNVAFSPEESQLQYSGAVIPRVHTKKSVHSDIESLPGSEMEQHPDIEFRSRSPVMRSDSPDEDTRNSRQTDHSRYQDHSRSSNHSRNQSYSMSPDHSRNQDHSRYQDHSRSPGNSRRQDHAEYQDHSKSPDHSRNQDHSRYQDYSRSPDHSRNQDHSRYQDHSRNQDESGYPGHSNDYSLERRGGYGNGKTSDHLW